MINKYYRIYDNEDELRDLEIDLATELKVPYVKCEYDGLCSHKYISSEVKYRRQIGILNEDEYIINYEIYDSRKERDEHEGGVDGEVHELIYKLSIINDEKYIYVEDL